MPSMFIVYSILHCKNEYISVFVTCVTSYCLLWHTFGSMECMYDYSPSLSWPTLSTVCHC